MLYLLVLLQRVVGAFDLNELRISLVLLPHDEIRYTSRPPRVVFAHEPAYSHEYIRMQALSQASTATSRSDKTDVTHPRDTQQVVLGE